MTTLIANIGTSDLAIKIDDYYFPIGFDRSEPNTDYSDLTENEKAAWDRELRQTYITDVLCPELGVPVVNGKFSFRELTRSLLEAYHQDENTWHDRIRPGRIWGVVTTAQSPKFRVNTAYIFVTDQPHESDSIHLFDILEKWFKRAFPNLKFEKKVIPQNISAISQDGLLNYFYHFFLTDIISERNEPILISIKGGTPQMQTALKMQALASGFPQLLFIDPQLSIKKVLAGKPSSCQLTSYWRYMRSQKYQAVNLLLESRWDFDGAREILQDWKRVLNYLIREKVTDEIILSQSKETLSQSIQTLDLGMNLLNLDYGRARGLIRENPQLGFEYLVTSQGSDRLLNLYTQCRMYWELNQVANFLSRLGSFCEETLHHLLVQLGSVRYFDKRNYPTDWHLDKGRVEPTLWNYFAKRQQNIPNNPTYRLSNRFSKWNFVDALIQFRSQSQEIAPWRELSNSLNKLDYWIEKRNDLIHSAIGVSKQSMSDLLQNDRANGDEYALDACNRDQIIAEMTNISCKTSELLNQPANPFVGVDAPYYIYSDIRKWVADKLMSDGLR